MRRYHQCMSPDPASDAVRLLDSAWGDSIPVDPVRIAIRLGIKVREATTLASSIPVALVKQAEEDPVILLNAGDSVNRKRFSCAHALGHFMQEQDEEYCYIADRTIFSSHSDYADVFAGVLLMPAWARRGLLSCRDSLELAIRYDIPREVIAANR